jgi:hypothetical protein
MAVLTDKQVLNLNRMNEAAQNVKFGELLETIMTQLGISFDENGDIVVTPPTSNG